MVNRKIIIIITYLGIYTTSGVGIISKVGFWIICLTALLLFGMIGIFRYFLRDGIELLWRAGTKAM